METPTGRVLCLNKLLTDLFNLKCCKGTDKEIYEIQKYVCKEKLDEAIRLDVLEYEPCVKQVLRFVSSPFLPNKWREEQYEKKGWNKFREIQKDLKNSDIEFEFGGDSTPAVWTPGTIPLGVDWNSFWPPEWKEDEKSPSKILEAYGADFEERKYPFVISYSKRGKMWHLITPYVLSLPTSMSFYTCNEPFRPESSVCRYTLGMLLIDYPEQFYKVYKRYVRPQRRKKIAFFGGCLCPPHKGHLHTIFDLSKKYDLVYVGIFDNVNRHNWPISLTIRWLEKYFERIDLKNVILVTDDKNKGGYPQLYPITNNIYEASRDDEGFIIYGEDYLYEHQGKKANYLNNRAKQNGFQTEVLKRDKNSPSATKMSRLTQDILKREVDDSLLEAWVRNYFNPQESHLINFPRTEEVTDYINIMIKDFVPEEFTQNQKRDFILDLIKSKVYP